MQAVTKRPGFVAGEHLLGQRELLGDPQQELNRPKALRRLRRASVDDAHHHVAIQMHINPQLNRLGFDSVLSALRRLFLALCFGSFTFVSINHRASGVVNFAALDDPMLSFPQLDGKLVAHQ